MKVRGLPSLTKVQVVPGAEKAPEPLEPKATLPAGSDFVPDAVSVTVAVQTVAWPTTTLPGTQATDVLVARSPLNVTVRDGLAPRTALHGFVVPKHVEELRFVCPLQPAKVDVPFGVARNVTVAPLSEVVIFGRHVVVTVCEEAEPPVPPQLTGAVTAPVLGVTLTEPPPEPAKVKRRFRAAAT